MSGKSSNPITTRSGASVPDVGDPTSTPLVSQSSNPRPDGQFVMPQTPERREKLFLRRLAAVTSATQPSSTPSGYHDPNQSGNNSQYGSQLQPARLQEVSQASYHNTTSVLCDTLKANRLTETETTMRREGV